MKIILYILAFMMFLTAILGGLYVAFGWCLIGGLLQAIHAYKSTPMDDTQLVYGIVRVLATTVAGVLTFLVGVLMSFVLGLIASLIKK